MSARVVCPACNEVVYPDAVVLSDHVFGYTWDGDRAKWTHATFGLVHLCSPRNRMLVKRRDRRRVAAPPLSRWLVRHRFRDHPPDAAERFLPRVLILANDIDEARGDE